MTQPSVRLVKAAAIEIATQASGLPGDPPVLLIMGATASMLWWPDALVRTLSGCGCYVIRYDSRDTGQSTTVAPGESSYSVDDLVEDMWAVLDSYQLPAAHLVGMSLGGMVAQIASLQRPDRVLSLTLISAEPIGGIAGPVPGISQSFMDHFAGMSELDWTSTEDVCDFLVEIARLSAGSAHPFDAGASRSRALAELARTQSMQSSFNHATLQGGDAYLGRLGEIAVPTLILHGSEDPIIDIANGVSLEQQIPGARLEVLDGVGHELPAAVLPQIATAILDFVAEATRR